MISTSQEEVLIEPDVRFLKSVDEYSADHHPCQYRLKIEDYKNHLTIENSGDTNFEYKFSSSGDNDHEAIEMLSKTLVTWSIDDLRNIVSFCDNNTGDLCWYTWEPVYHCQDIVSRSWKVWLTLWFKILITDKLEEFCIGVSSLHDLSLLQHALDQMGTSICLIPSEDCFW